MTYLLYLRMSVNQPNLTTKLSIPCLLYADDLVMWKFVCVLFYCHIDHRLLEVHISWGTYIMYKWKWLKFENESTCYIHMINLKLSMRFDNTYIIKTFCSRPYIQNWMITNVCEHLIVFSKYFNIYSHHPIHIWTQSSWCICVEKYTLTGHVSESHTGT